MFVPMLTAVIGGQSDKASAFTRKIYLFQHINPYHCPHYLKHNLANLKSDKILVGLAVTGVTRFGDLEGLLLTTCWTQALREK